MAGTAISFDGNSLQTANIITSKIDKGFPDKNMSFLPIARANRSLISGVNYPSRRIRISGKLQGSSIANMDALEDTFKAYFNDQDSYLDIGHNGGTRRFIATVNGMAVDRPDGLQYADFAIEFVCTNPFGIDTSSTSLLSATARTSASYTDSLTIAGTAPLQYPVITITIGSVTGGTNKTITVGNPNNGQQISITNTFIAGNVIVIDCNPLTRSVKIDGTDVAFSGAFMEYTVGAQQISYVDSFTTRQFNISVDYIKHYM
jgi:hypothetical protein